eukprot:tig00021036_g17396.t1
MKGSWTISAAAAGRTQGLIRFAPLFEMFACRRGAYLGFSIDMAKMLAAAVVLGGFSLAPPESRNVAAQLAVLLSICAAHLCFLAVVRPYIDNVENGVQMLAGAMEICIFGVIAGIAFGPAASSGSGSLEVALLALSLAALLLQAVAQLRFLREAFAILLPLLRRLRKVKLSVLQRAAARSLEPDRLLALQIAEVKVFKKAEWTEHRTVSDGKSSHTVTDHFEGKHEFFRVPRPLPLASAPRAVPPPTPAPRFHEERGSYKARICYKLKARPGAASIVEVPGPLKPNTENSARVPPPGPPIARENALANGTAAVPGPSEPSRTSPLPFSAARRPPSTAFAPKRSPGPPSEPSSPHPADMSARPQRIVPVPLPTKLSAIGLLRRPRTDFEELADFVRSVPDAEGQRRLWRELAEQARGYKKRRSLVDQMEGLAAAS